MLRETIQSALGGRLKGLVIRPAGSLWTPAPVTETRTWNLHQFGPLRESFELLLGHEAFRGERYSHVMRVRTDTIFLTPWQSLQQLALAVPQGTVAGPKYSLQKLFPYFLTNVPLGPAPGIVNDQFWIASRTVSWQLMVMFPFLLWNPPSSRELLHVCGCQLYGDRMAADTGGEEILGEEEEEESKPFDVNDPRCQSQGAQTQECMHNLALRHQEHILRRKRNIANCNFGSASVRAACHTRRCGGHLAISEALLTYFLRTRVGLDKLVDSCSVTGPFVLNDAHTSFNRPCLHWEGANNEHDHFPNLNRVLDDLKRHIDRGAIERRGTWHSPHESEQRIERVRLQGSIGTSGTGDIRAGDGKGNIERNTHTHTHTHTAPRGDGAGNILAFNSSINSSALQQNSTPHADESKAHQPDTSSKSREFAAQGWRANATLADQDMMDFYKEAISTTNRFHRYGWNSWAHDQKPAALGIKAYVLSHLRNRRASTERMIRAAGFDDVEFPDTRDDVNLDELVASFDVSATFSKGTISQRLKNLAHALDYRDTLDTAIAHTPTGNWVAIFEDDIILTTTPSQASGIL